MRFAKILLAGTAALALHSAAFADDMQTGTVTQIDRIKGTVSVQQSPSGTVGASTGAATEEYKAQTGAMLDSVHAGDKVGFAVSGADGAKMITKIEKR